MKENFFAVIQKKIRFRLRHFFYYHFSFSPFGFIVFVLTLLLLFRALFVRNVYEIIFSSAVLCLMFVMFVQGKWKSSKYKNFKAAWKPPSPYIAELCNDNGEREINSEASIITGLDVSVSLFFRLHFFVRGEFYLLGSVNSLYVSAETSLSRGGKAAELQLDFPMSGNFACEYFCRIHDIFGFYSFPCGVPQEKIIRVRSAPFFGKKNYLTAMSREEDTHSKTSMSEDRYYMREYAPGDRLRDINWKSSEKLDVLVTRISPDNQEKISRIEIFFRNYGSEDIASLEALWLLDRAKARLSHFLNSIHDEHPAYIFHIHSAQCSWEINNSDELESFLGTSDIFWDELKKNGPGSDGFTHNPASFRLEVFNGSNVNTLNSDIINIKGRRASAVMFDESGWMSSELFVQCEQFVNQSSDFRLGGNIDVSLEPKSFPRQLIYTSSASDTESGFYSKFRQFTQRMLIGDDRYFACNFTVDMALHPTFNGGPYAPLIEQDKVDQSMASDKERAERELYNKFTSGSYEGQILTRREIMQHTERRKPLLTNDTGLRKFVCAWDSARINDNSAIIWAEFILDEQKGWTAHIQNVVTMVDVNSKQKIQMRIPEQVERFKSLLLEYNGTNHGKMDYENIMAIMCDSGSGGQMVGGIADYIVEDWISKDGKTHRGIIDSQHKANQAARYSFPNAIDIMKLIDPRGNRNEIFDSLEKMVKLGVVTFPIDFDGKDYFINIDDNGNEVRYDLNEEEQLALVQCDMLKTEITTMCKYVNGGSIRYEYPPDKRNKVRDDRAFACGLITYYLQRLRSGHAFEKKIEPIDMRQYTSLATKPALLNRHNTYKRR